MTVKVKLETITPKKAEMMWENNGQNRNLSDRHVERYKRDMTNGRWGNNGETIKLSIAGEILDGQHRIKAVMESGVTVEMWVARGVEEDDACTIDSGRSRTAANVLQIKGQGCASLLSSSMNVVAYMLTTGKMKSGKAKMFNNSEVLEASSMLPGLYDKCKYIKAKHSPLIATALFCGLSYLFGKNDKVKAILYLDYLAGDDPIEGDYNYSGLKILRKKLIQYRANRYKKVPREIIAALMIKAWNSFYNGTDVRALRHQLEYEFPVIEDMELLKPIIY